MRRLAGALLLVLALAGGVFAQGAPQLDFVAFETVATRAEALVLDPDAANEDLEAVRAELVLWRSGFLAAESANQATVDRLQGQLDALGPPPSAEAGQTEPEEIANRRAELNRLLGEAQVPRVNALEAFNRTSGLVGQIDAIIRARQNEALLQRAPSPLRPLALPEAALALKTVGRSIVGEVATTLADEDRLAVSQRTAIAWITLIVVGALLLLRGRTWVGGLANAAHRRKARESLVFFVSLGQVLLPVLGAILIIAAIVVSGLPGERLTGLLAGVAGLLATTFAALWLAGRLFPPGEAPSVLDLDEAQSARVRRIAVGIGIVLGVGGILGVLAQFEEIDQGTRAVLMLPYFLAFSALFWSLSVVLKSALQAEQETEGGFLHRITAVEVVALRVVALAGAMLALVGYINAAEALMRPTAMTLGLIALFLAVQVPIRDLYAFATRTPVEEAGRALFPVLLNFVLAIAALPVLALIWGARWAELSEFYARFTEGFTLGGARITPGDVLTVMLVFALALLVTRLLQAALKSTVLPRTRMDVGAQNAIASGVGYVGIAVAAILAITAGGIDLTALAFVISALSIGIGFGLRNVIENFVAGLILLIERPIGEGDWIEVGGNMGIVKQISVRSTVIETFDRQQLIVPNGDFITGTVTNWTRGSQVGRAVVTVGVAYGTDTRRVQQILLEIAKEQRGVMLFPEPGVDFMGFGADSLEFRVRALLFDVNTLLSVKTEMHHRIAERFREEGIEIPFAQRDIWLRNPEALAAAREAPATAPADVIAAAEVPKPARGRPRKHLRREPDAIEDAADQDGDHT